MQEIFANVPCLRRRATSTIAFGGGVTLHEGDVFQVVGVSVTDTHGSTFLIQTSIHPVKTRMWDAASMFRRSEPVGTTMGGRDVAMSDGCGTIATSEDGTRTRRTS